MQRHDLVNTKNLEDNFCELCRTALKLPRKTPIFVTDCRGRILVGKNISLPKESCVSLYDIIERDEDFIGKSLTGLPFCLRLDKRKLRGFATMSQSTFGLYNFVICTYSESGCFKLSEYFAKLCAFRNFLEKLRNMDFDSERNNALSVFASRIRAIGYLMEMSDESAHNSKITPVSLVHLFAKLSGFAHNASKEVSEGCEVNLDGDDFVVGISAKFVSIALCCLGLVIRNSADGKASVNIEDYDAKSAIVTMKSKSLKRENDILYKNAVISHAMDCMSDVRFIEKPDEYCIELVVNKAKTPTLSVSERGAADVRLDEILSDETLFDLFGTVSDII